MGLLEATLVLAWIVVHGFIPFRLVLSTIPYVTNECQAVFIERGSVLCTADQ